MNHHFVENRREVLHTNMAQYNDIFLYYERSDWYADIHVRATEMKENRIDVLVKYHYFDFDLDRTNFKFAHNSVISCDIKGFKNW